MNFLKLWISCLQYRSNSVILVGLRNLTLLQKSSQGVFQIVLPRYQESRTMRTSIALIIALSISTISFIGTLIIINIHIAIVFSMPISACNMRREAIFSFALGVFDSFSIDFSIDYNPPTNTSTDCYTN